MHIYAVGDIHGESGLLDDIIEQIAIHAGCLEGPKHLVFLGDYIDRGPDSKGVIERLMKLHIEGFSIVCLKGNHEDMLIRFLESREAYSWLMNGGVETCKSYGCEPSRMWVEFPEAHRKWMKNLPVFHGLGDYLFVHAGIDPKTELHEQRPATMMWIRDEFLHHNKHLGKTVVHGHTPSREPEVKVHRIGIDTGAHYYGCLTAVYLGGEQPQFIQVKK